MTHITCTFSSVCMETDASFHVLLPSVRNGLLPLTGPLIPEGGFPTLYLLHGIGDSAQSWLLNSQIGLLCDKYRIAVVLPSCQNSFYADSPDGPKAFSYLLSFWTIPAPYFPFPAGGKTPSSEAIPWAATALCV